MLAFQSVIVDSAFCEKKFNTDINMQARVTFTLLTENNLGHWYQAPSHEYDTESVPSRILPTDVSRISHRAERTVQ